MLKYAESPLFWGSLFALGCLAGYLFHVQLLPPLTPSIKIGLEVGNRLDLVGLAAALTALIILIKNSLVALLCALTGRLSRGTFPLIVCVVNGVIVGILAALFAAQGTEVWRFATALLPHGIIELPAIFIACALGMRALETKGRLKHFRLPFAMLAAAAVIEAWISPIVVSNIL